MVLGSSPLCQRSCRSIRGGVAHACRLGMFHARFPAVVDTLWFPLLRGMEGEYIARTVVGGSSLESTGILGSQHLPTPMYISGDVSAFDNLRCFLDRCRREMPEIEGGRLPQKVNAFSSVSRSAHLEPYEPRIWNPKSQHNTEVLWRGGERIPRASAPPRISRSWALRAGAQFPESSLGN